MRYLAPVLFGLLLVFVACQPVVTLDKPAVEWTVKDNGATLELSWDAVTDADGYKVYFDGHTTADTTLTATKIAIDDPKKTIKVEAYNGTETSDSTISTLAATAQTITVYGLSDPTHYDCAFGFDADGSAMVLDCSLQADFPKMDYVIEDRAPIAMSFYSPNEFGTPYNSKIDGALESGTDFDALTGAPTTGTYGTKTAFTQNSVYALWMGTSTQWQSSDHFAKAKVVSVSGTAVTLKVAYQTIGGLRWLITE